MKIPNTLLVCRVVAHFGRYTLFVHSFGFRFVSSTLPPRSSEHSDADSAHSSAADGATKTDGCCRCSKCCTPCFAFLCRPCTKLGRLACCRRCCRRTKKPDADAVAAAGTDSAEHPTSEKRSFASRFCGCCRRSKPEHDNDDEAPAVATTVDETSTAMSNKEPGKCALCLSKFLCCRRTNKVQEEQRTAATTAAATAAAAAAAAAGSDAISPARRMCCWCIPCGRKKQPDAGREAWAERRESILSEPDKR